MAKSEKKEKPGVMIYWETFDALNNLTAEETKAIVDAVGIYGRYKEKPSFQDRLLSVVWSQIEPKIDRDDDRYEEIRAIRAEAGHKGGIARANNIKQNQANEANATFDEQIKPTTTTAIPQHNSIPLSPTSTTQLHNQNSSAKASAEGGTGGDVPKRSPMTMDNDVFTGITNVTADSRQAQINALQNYSMRSGG